jgi:hypothetical protein
MLRSDVFVDRINRINRIGMHRHDSVARFATRRIAPLCHPKDLMVGGSGAERNRRYVSQERSRRRGIFRAAAMQDSSLALGMTEMAMRSLGIIGFHNS